MINVARRRRLRGLDGQGGETLIELLVTVFLLSIAIITILGGLLALSKSANLLGQATTGNVLAQDYAEQLEQPIADPSVVGSSPYIACATVAGTPGVTAYPIFTPPLRMPANWTVKIVAIDYLSIATPAGGSPTWTQTCPGTDLGAQQIYIDAFSTVGLHPVRERVVIVKRNQSCPILSGLQVSAGPC